jgi:hypothetical protein
MTREAFNLLFRIVTSTEDLTFCCVAKPPSVLGRCTTRGFCNANLVLGQTNVKTCSHCQTSSAFLSRTEKRRNNVLSSDLQAVAAPVQLLNALLTIRGGKPIQITGSLPSDRAPGARVRFISLSSVIVCRFLWQWMGWWARGGGDMPIVEWLETYFHWGDPGWMWLWSALYLSVICSI